MNLLRALLIAISCTIPLKQSACWEIPGASWVYDQFHILQLSHHFPADMAPQGTPIYTDPAKILQMYQLMKDVHEVFTHYKVTYWIDSGTLLGAVRHKGIIPWDDDIDLCIDKSSIEMVYTIAPVLEELGYIVTKAWGLVLRIQKKDNKEVFADLIPTEQRGDKIYYAPTILIQAYSWLYGDNGLFGYRDGEEIFIAKDELYPLKEYQFGSITVMGPQNPTKYQEGMYGKDFMDVAYQWHAHENDSLHAITKVKKILTDEDRVPAQPVGPLRESVTDLARKSN